MKKITLSAFSLLMLISCGNDNPISKTIGSIKETTNEIKKVNESVGGITNLKKNASSMSENIERLSKLEPLSNDDIKNWLPNEISNLKRSAFKTGDLAMMKISSASATYNNDDKSKELNISIIDGAGELAASSVVGMTMGIVQDFEEQDDRGYRKTTERDGQRIIEEFRNGNSNIKMFAENRFMFEAKGRNIDPDELWQLIKAFNIQKLSN